MDTLTKVAGCQIDIELKNVEANLKKLGEFISESHAKGAQLSVFPECALTGYCFEGREEAFEFAETIPGPSTQRISEVARQLGVSTIFGMIEKEDSKMFNSCVLIGPQGIIGKHRKIHLPFLGVDRFLDPGNSEFKIFSVGQIRIGMIICYDGSFPESARSLSLLGADLIVLPTNWPMGSFGPATFVCQTRAFENHVYYMGVDRVGSEQGFKFIGQSKICDPTGKILAQLDEVQEGILYAEINPEHSRNKQIIKVPGKYELNYFKDRRPEFYGAILETPKK